MTYRNLTRSDLEIHLEYHPKEGHFTWKPKPDSNHRNRLVGKIAGGTKYKNKRYARIDIPGGETRVSVLIHYLVWFFETGSWPGPKDQLDHRDGDKTNNRFSNLRLVTHAENSRNRKITANNSSGFKGISLCKKNKNKPYRVSITYNKKLYFLGSYATLEEAKEVRRKAELKYYGEFSRHQS